MVAFPKRRRIANIFLKKEFYHFACFASVRRPCELWKTKCMRAHTHTHIQSYAQVYTHIHINTHAHKDTRMHASVCKLIHTHTKYSFVIWCQSLWNHMPDTAKEVGFIGLLRRYFKRSYLVNLSKYRLFLNL